MEFTPLHKLNHLVSNGYSSQRFGLAMLGVARFSRNIDFTDEARQQKNDLTRPN